MKKLYTVIIAFISVFSLTLLSSSCSDIPEVIDELDLANVLTPTSTSATISITDGRTTTFTWSSSSTATKYALEIYRWDSGSEPSSVSDDMLTSPYLNLEVPQGTSGTTTSYTQFLEADYVYYARVKGQNPEGGQGDSKWAAFRYPIEPYLIMDPVLTFEMTGRTDKSISLAWTIDEGDSDGINQIRVSPNPDNAASSYKVYNVSSGATEYTVDGLSPLTEYTLSANFGTATRGTIVEWTMPNTEGATTVTDSASFVNALITWDYSLGALKLVVDYNNGETYNAGAIPVLGELEITGNGVANNPVIKGYFNIYEAGDFTVTYDEVDYTVTSVGASSLKVTNLSMSGGNYSYSNAITNHGATEKTMDIEVTNCEFDSYTSGVFYDNSKATTYATVSFNGVYVTNTGGTGGDFFDVRSSTISNFSVTNSTFTDGCRTFVRYQGATIGDVDFSNNTINAMAGADDSNNKGIFRIVPTEPNSFKLSGNLFLNCNGSDEYTVLAWTGTAAPSYIEKNFFYNNAADFLYDNEKKSGNGHKDITASVATANGGAILTDDPCYDSIRGNFYVTDPDVISAKAGDPRWFGDYIEQPEPELEVVPYGYSWDLTDTKTFYDEIDQTVTRGNIRFFVTDTPFTVSDAGLYFTGKSTLMSYSGVPTDGAFEFIVDGPGSVVLSTNGGWNSQIEVSYAPYNAATGSITTNTTTVAGSVSAGAEDEYITLMDIPEDHSEVYVIYVYSSSAIYLTELSWTNELGSGVSTELGTPENVTISESSLKIGTDTDVVISWDEVVNAATYTIYCNGDVSVEGIATTSYTFNASALDTGVYEYQVQAVPGEGSSRTASALSAAVSLEITNNWDSVPADAVTTWGIDTWTACYDKWGSNTLSDDTLWSDGMLYFLNGGGSGFKFATTNYSEDLGAQYRVQLAGSGSAEKCCLQFKTTTSGTLKIETISSGTTTRYLQVYVNGTAFGDTLLAESTSDASYPSERVLEVSGISNESTISIASTAGGINIFVVKWIPTGVSE